MKQTCIFLAFFLSFDSNSKCHGKFTNPISDICWSCMFPISIGSKKMFTKAQIDKDNPKSAVCFCKKFPSPVKLPGISVGFYEPARIIEVTKDPYCMLTLGGIEVGKSNEKLGGCTNNNSGEKTSFYHVHYYFYPVVLLLKQIPGFSCLENLGFDIGFMSEFDLTWNDESWAIIFNPEAAAFSNPITQAACAADCIASTIGFPLNKLFWCAGCQGSIYPFTGFVGNHIGGVESSILIVQRFLAKLHKMGLLKKTSGKEALCEQKTCLLIRKSQYKTQMVYPSPSTNKKIACNPLGRTSMIWGAGKEYPNKGESFAYLIWRKRNCCSINSN